MRRRPEAYHEKLRARQRRAAVADASDETDGTDGGDRPASIHDIVTKQSGLSDLLHYDAYERRSGLVRLLPLETTPREIAEGSANDLVDTLTIPWELEGISDDRVTLRLRTGPFELRKEIVIGGGRLDPTLSVDVEATNVSAAAVDGLLGIEFALMLLGGGHNPAAFHAVDGRRIAHDESLVAQAVEGLRAGNEQVGVAVETVADGPVDAWISPIESVSNSSPGSSSSTRAARSCSTASSTSPRARLPGSASSSRQPSPPTSPSRRSDPPVTRGRLAVHAHFYQPSRLDPWTGRVPEEPGAAPFHDWNARVDAECYRPNAHAQPPSDLLGPRADARVVDGDGNSDDARRLRRGRRRGQRDGPGLPPHDPAARLGGRPTDRDPLGPPRLRAAVRPAAGRAVAAGNRGRPADAADRRRGGRPLHDPRPVAGRRDRPRQPPPVPGRPRDGASIVVVFYDAGLSAAVSFEPEATSDADRSLGSESPFASAARPHGPPSLAVIATDGELYGHHQQFRDLFLQRLVAPDPASRTARLRRRFACRLDRRSAGPSPPDGPDRRANLVELPSRRRPLVGRVPGRDRRPLEGPAPGRPRTAGGGHRRRFRALVRVGSRRAGPLGAPRRVCRRRRRRGDPGVRGRAPRGPRLERPLPRVALLEAQRWRLAMFASDAWFWDDPIRPETKQVLRSAARAVRLVDGELGTALEDRLVADLGLFSSPSRGLDGAAIYRTALAEIGQPAHA